MKRRPGFGYKIAVLITLISVAVIVLMAAGCGGDSDDDTRGTSSTSADYGELLANSDFFNGLENWSLIDTGGTRAHGTNNVEITAVGETNYAVHMTRTCPENDAGAAGVSQKLDKLILPESKLTIKAMVKADLQRGDTIAATGPGSESQAPVIFRVLYDDPDGDSQQWYHGFYYSDIQGADKDRFTSVRQGVWTTYLSGDLTTEIKEGSTVTEFQVYGNGWDFDGSAYDISFTLSR
ncbi:MAG: hypothetical protein JXA49_01185 [Actinobacteria bacterium]|nr:hypothetical protein [Actinomycetota bacterium]